MSDSHQHHLPQHPYPSPYDRPNIASHIAHASVPPLASVARSSEFYPVRDAPGSSSAAIDAVPGPASSTLHTHLQHGNSREESAPLSITYVERRPWEVPDETSLPTSLSIWPAYTSRIPSLAVASTLSTALSSNVSSTPIRSAPTATSLGSSSTPSSNRSIMTPTRRKRLTKDQTADLMDVYAITPYPDMDLRKRIAIEMELSPDFVRVWFSNRRNAQRRQRNRIDSGIAGGQDNAPVLPTNGNSPHSDDTCAASDSSSPTSSKGRKRAFDEVDHVSNFDLDDSQATLVNSDSRIVVVEKQTELKDVVAEDMIDSNSPAVDHEKPSQGVASLSSSVQAEHANDRSRNRSTSFPALVMSADGRAVVGTEETTVSSSASTLSLQRVISVAPRLPLPLVNKLQDCIGKLGSDMDLEEISVISAELMPVVAREPELWERMHSSAASDTSSPSPLRFGTSQRHVLNRSDSEEDEEVTLRLIANRRAAKARARAEEHEFAIARGQAQFRRQHLSDANPCSQPDFKTPYRLQIPSLDLAASRDRSQNLGFDRVLADHRQRKAAQLAKHLEKQEAKSGDRKKAQYKQRLARGGLGAKKKATGKPKAAPKAKKAVAAKTVKKPARGKGKAVANKSPIAKSLHSEGEVDESSSDIDLEWSSDHGQPLAKRLRGDGPRRALYPIQGGQNNELVAGLASRSHSAPRPFSLASSQPSDLRTAAIGRRPLGHGNALLRSTSQAMSSSRLGALPARRTGTFPALSLYHSVDHRTSTQITNDSGFFGSESERKVGGRHRSTSVSSSSSSTASSVSRCQRPENVDDEEVDELESDDESVAPVVEQDVPTPVRRAREQKQNMEQAAHVLLGLGAWAGEL